MKASVRHYDSSNEYYFDEGCWINELSNQPDDPAVSIARARVLPGVTTQWHRLDGIEERYIVIEGTALVEVEGIDGTEISEGDAVLIPSMKWQRITNTGRSDLVFLAICTPRFEPRVYQEKEQAN